MPTEPPRDFPSAPRALSIQQPWAWLIANGYKDIENRDWPTKYRGALLIHAGKKFDAPGEAWVRRTLPGIELPFEGDLEFGGIVGGARLADCVTRSDSPWFQGRYGFVLKNQQPLRFRACRGMLGLFHPMISEPSNV